ncbi:hypothetical cytosolic protein [Syntrophus aciditrophicus SB]|uniref:Hypothetical cytosolic protein n=1 Tax=Syntrophus aciditrophicus (strain SB) TaxID=56780 RepID=Q2LYG6_SYNAS|nr:hypothetical cytosolic protein [Syntrophus aciditrophicus SB]
MIILCLLKPLGSGRDRDASNSSEEKSQFRSGWALVWKYGSPSDLPGNGDRKDLPCRKKEKN